MRRVTIILPAYNRADLVCRALRSIQETVDSRHEVVVADDRSTEADFERKVRAEIAGDPRVRYVRNSRNLGFVGNCNQNIALADPSTDILLLNSDAVLTPGALEEMIACLDCSDRHGVVCPRSNAATILTIPQTSDTEPDHRERSYACWKRVSPLLPRTAVIPTGVGFCMLIRRDLILRFGCFDDIYGRGYNEENDFCMRIARYGFSAVMANHAYVFHDEGSSFSSQERIELERRNRNILLSRYPEYPVAVQKYCERLPASEYFADILGGYRDQKRIVVDLSGLIPAHNGTSEYALSLTKELVPLLRDLHVSIMISRTADRFFGVSSQYQNVLIAEDSPKQHFDLSFTPQQIFDIDHLERLHRMAVKMIVCMQDVIALRCHTIQHPSSPEVVRLTARFASGILSVTRASLEDFIAWMSTPLRTDLLTSAVLHAYPDRSLSIDADQGVHDEGFIFVVGNHYNHKAVREALSALPRGRRIIVLGSKVHADACKSRDALLLESGTLSSAFVSSLYMRAAVVVFPTQYEGFGLPLLHAAAAGTRVVAFDAAPAREIVEAFGLQHCVTLCRDFREMAAVVGLADGKKCPRPSSVRTWADVARDTEKFIREVLAAPINHHLLQERFDFFHTISRVRQKAVSDRYSLRIIRSLCLSKARKIFSTCKRAIFG